LRQIVAQLRQENTELKHRVRHFESRKNSFNNNSKATNFTTSSASFLNNSNNSFLMHNNNNNNNNSSSVDNLLSINSKLKKQVDFLKKELSDATVVYEKFKFDMTRQVEKLKSKTFDINETTSNVNFNDKNEQNDESSRATINVLKKQLFALQQQLFSERLNSKKNNNNHNNYSNFSNLRSNRNKNSNESNYNSDSNYYNNNNKNKNLFSKKNDGFTGFFFLKIKKKK
jgi:hypothetical protein